MANIHEPSVLMILESWGIGGTEIYVERLIDYLRSKGYSVRLVFLVKNDAPENSWGVRSDIVDLFALRRFLGGNDVRLCHLHLYTHLLPATAILKTLRIPIVTTLHMPFCAWGTRHRIYTWLAAFLADRVVGVSREVCSGLARRNVCPYVMPGPLGMEFTEVRRERRDTDAFRVVSVGRLSREKRIDVLIRAIGKCSSMLGKNASLIHFGGGPLHQELSALARELGVMVEWKGFRPRAEIARALAQSDVFVLPSQFEGSPLAAVEAMSAGVPAILSDFPAAQELITDEVTGHIFPIGDADALAERLVWHAENPEQSAAIGEAGRDFVLARFSEDRCFGQYLSIYDELLHA